VVNGDATREVFTIYVPPPVSKHQPCVSLIGPRSVIKPILVQKEQEGGVIPCATTTFFRPTGSSLPFSTAAPGVIFKDVFQCWPRYAGMQTRFGGAILSLIGYESRNSASTFLQYARTCVLGRSEHSL
jgi:hypothetical protein